MDEGGGYSLIVSQKIFNHGLKVHFNPTGYFFFYLDKKKELVLIITCQTVVCTFSLKRSILITKTSLVSLLKWYGEEMEDETE